MRKSFTVLAALAMLVPLAQTASAAPTKTAKVTIVPVANGAVERATVNLTANAGNAGFSATGTGSGFSPVSQYVSLVYGLASVPVQTGPKPPCADDGTLGDPNVSSLRMFVGAWLPVIGGNRSLAGNQPTTTLDQINTMSIRRANLPVLPGPGDIRPQVFQIRSCGLVTNRIK
nr:hypothetical protein [Kibdelosporangium sp. MJ126-NF4]CEL18695.1 hypothetical protein [Kibdelosporangium sp. MJ126-NF4]CTQ98179.1 hypothetical protein [Kibdelosporangium sp. MJ126-NF4]